MFVPNPILVDIGSANDTQYRGYITGSGDVDFTTYNIGRTSDTGPGDVGSEIVNPDGDIDPNNPGFPTGSSVAYYSIWGGKQINVILSGSSEKRERVGAFYVKALLDGESIQITTIKKASQGEAYFGFIYLYRKGRYYIDHRKL